MKFYTYHINLNERGEFYADVRNDKHETVFEIKSNDDGIIELIEDGFIKNINDTHGLAKYLVSVGIVSKNSVIVGV